MVGLVVARCERRDDVGGIAGQYDVGHREPTARAQPIMHRGKQRLLRDAVEVMDGKRRHHEIERSVGEPTPPKRATTYDADDLEIPSFLRRK